jgi:hypothetical protein
VDVEVEVALKEDRRWWVRLRWKLGRSGGAGGAEPEAEVKVEVKVTAERKWKWKSIWR